MFREISIIITVIVFIITLDIITNKYTIYAGDELSNNLYNLREEILKEDKEKIDSKIKQIDNGWDEYNKKLSYYMEHDELEKVGTNLTALKAHIEVEEYEDAIENLDETVFILQHIQEKEKFSIRSIF